jgi:hypothetical protein
MGNFLDQGLLSTSDTSVKRILLVELRCRRIVSEALNGAHGWWFQAQAPFATLLTVRESAQASRNRTDVGLLRRALAQKGIDLWSVVFESQLRTVPLSWHLTQREIDDTNRDWEQNFNNPVSCEINAVRDFLAGRSPQSACGQDACPSRSSAQTRGAFPCSAN